MLSFYEKEVKILSHLKEETEQQMLLSKNNTSLIKLKTTHKNSGTFKGDETLT